MNSSGELIVGWALEADCGPIGNVVIAHVCRV
jgi:hypothetical protein